MIRPEYRREGYAKKAVLGYFKNHPGIYCKLMVEKNEATYAFWAAAKAEAHAEDIRLAEIAGAAEEGEKQEGFRIR